MNFTTKNFDLTIEDINKKLGLPKGIEVDYHLHYGCIMWNAEIEKKEWGIRSIMGYITDYEIEISWSIDRTQLNTKDTQKLLQNDLGEFYPAELTLNFITGKIRIDNKKYTVNNLIELAGDLLKINEVIINFNDYEITII